MRAIWSGIAGRIASGYVIIVVVTLVISFSTFFVVRDLRSADAELSETIMPLYIGLRDLKNLTSISYKLTSNWIYQPTAGDKEDLTRIFQGECQEHMQRLQDIAAHSHDDKQIKKLLDQFKSIIIIEMDITARLNADSLYNNDEVVDEVISLLDNRLKPSAAQFAKDIDRQLDAQLATLDSARAQKASLYSRLTLTVVGSSILFALVGVLASWISVKSIVRPIRQLRALILRLSRGEIAEVNIRSRGDEIGEMVAALTTLTAGMRSNTQFAMAIGQGRYDSSFEPLSEDDHMGNALLQMRGNLRRVSEEESRRNWAMGGLAKLGEIIRSADKAEILYDRVTQFMVTYVQANQGALFIVEDSDPADVHLRMAGCYAYDRKKHLDKRVEIGEGLVGQCYQERDMIYLKEVPRSYVHITSGLGEAMPRTVLLVPLKVEDKVHGVAEIASFRQFEPHETEFIYRLAEGMGSFIRSTRELGRTAILLAELQEQREQLLQQEEVMRQHMEELSATQEAMLRKEQEYLRVIEAMKRQQHSGRALSDILMDSAGGQLPSDHGHAAQELEAQLDRMGAGGVEVPREPEAQLVRNQKQL